ncbi:hypothetical protein PESHB4_01370 [Pediococcus ethanolidurans]
MKNQHLYTSNGFDHEKFVKYLGKKIIPYSSIMVSMSASPVAVKIYGGKFETKRMVEVIRQVNPKKRLKTTELGFFSYI